MGTGQRKWRGDAVVLTALRRVPGAQRCAPALWGVGVWVLISTAYLELPELKSANAELGRDAQYGPILRHFRRTDTIDLRNLASADDNKMR